MTSLVPNPMSIATTEVAVIDTHARHAQAVHFTQDNKWLVSVGQDACVRLWSVPGFAAARAFMGHRNCVNSLAFTRDEQLVATASSDGSVRVWAFPSGDCRHHFEQQVAATLSPDGSMLATCPDRGGVTLWALASAQSFVSIAIAARRILALAFTADGRELLVGGDGPIYRFGVPDGQPRGVLAGHRALVTGIRFLPDGERLASIATDGTFRLWSMTTGRELQKVEVRGWQFALHPRSETVAVAGERAIELFSLEDGRRVHRIEVPLKGVYGVTFSPDGRCLANAAADGRVRIWQLNAD